MSIKLITKSFLLDSGERSCLIINTFNKLPLYDPNLFLTTQFRNKSDSFSTIVSAANNLVIYLNFLDSRKINLKKRILDRKFLSINEIDDISDYAQKQFSKITNNKSNNVVSSTTHYMRISTIAQYNYWYANYLIRFPTSEDSISIKRIDRLIKARRPVRKGRNNRQDKSLNNSQIEVLFEIIRINSSFNPFDINVQKRNRLIILLLYYLGIRGGELLNLRIQDIDFSKKYLKIVRRADEKDDPRILEPNVKTLERTIPLGEILSKELHDYILKDRRAIHHARKNDFLFITHKSGPTVGKPISKSAYYKIFNTIKLFIPDLQQLTGHRLRHTWNRKFSERMDQLDQIPSQERQEQIRSYLMGWNPGSQTASTYNKRYIEKQAQDAALKLQPSIKFQLLKKEL